MSLTPEHTLGMLVMMVVVLQVSGGQVASVGAGHLPPPVVEHHRAEEETHEGE